VEEAKEKASAEGIEDWKKLVKTKPPKLEQKLKEIISQMYKATTNEVTKRKTFRVQNLSSLMENISATLV
jgi:hypothetical protein